MPTTNYVFHNQNPEGQRINDCVSKAISLATGLSYKTVNRLLAIVAQQYECDKLCVSCYQNLLTNYFGYKRYNCKKGTIVKDVLLDFPDDVLIIRIPGHLTCAKHGVILDTWDCTDFEVDCIWIID